MPDPVTATVGEPSPVPKRPTIYALAVLTSDGWTLWYAGGSREWIVDSQQPRHPGSVLVTVPGEE